MQIDDNPITLEIEDGHSEKKWQSGEVKLSQIFGELRVLLMVPQTVPCDDEQGENEKNVRSHRDIG